MVKLDVHISPIFSCRAIELDPWQAAKYDMIIVCNMIIIKTLCLLIYYNRINKKFEFKLKRSSKGSISATKSMKQVVVLC